MRKKLCIALLALGVFGGAHPAKALYVVVNVGLSGDPDNPTFTVTNTSYQNCCGNPPSPPADAVMDLFEILFQQPGYNFDKITNVAPIVDTGAPMTVTPVWPDAADGGQRSNLLRIALSGMEVNDSFQFNAELDKGGVETNEDYHTLIEGNSHVYFGGSFTIPNTWLSGVYPVRTFQDAWGPNGTYEAPQVVPLPPALPLMAGALAALGLLRRKKADSAPKPERRPGLPRR